MRVGSSGELGVLVSVMLGGGAGAAVGENRDEILLAETPRFGRDLKRLVNRLLAVELRERQCASHLEANLVGA